MVATITAGGYNPSKKLSAALKAGPNYLENSWHSNEQFERSEISLVVVNFTYQEH